MQLNTQRWQTFKFHKIFNIKKGFYNKKPNQNGEGTIPFIGATDKNNGVTGYYTLNEIENSSKNRNGKNYSLNKKLFPGKAICVTNNGSVGYAYYQKDTFTCSHDINPLYRKNGDFNEYTGLFIASIIMNDRYRWGYGRKWRPIRMSNSELKLPICLNKKNVPIIDVEYKYSDNGYIPDWQFMEDYIKSIQSNIPKTLNSSNNIKKLNTENWKKFYLHRLFNTKMGNGINATKTTNENPQYNYVSRNRNNNGVVHFVDRIPGKEPFQSGIMTLALGGSYLGNCFVQPRPFYTAQNVGILKPKSNISLYTKLFIATIIRNECKVKYQAFGRELNSHFRKDLIIKLPVKFSNLGNPIIDTKYIYSDDGYIPDWQFMEDYIKKLPNGDLI